jgi:hypothetical protein
MNEMLSYITPYIYEMLFFCFMLMYIVLTITRLWSSCHMRIYKFISVDIEILTHPEIAQGAKRSIVIWKIRIFRNGQLDCDNDRIIFAVMTSTYRQRGLVGVACVPMFCRLLFVLFYFCYGIACPSSYGFKWR